MAFSICSISVLRKGPPDAVRMRRLTIVGLATEKGLEDRGMFGIDGEDGDAIVLWRGG